eukprot:3987312-Lingulodinium_polyedra.AAC.1
MPGRRQSVLAQASRRSAEASRLSACNTFSARCGIGAGPSTPLSATPRLRSLRTSRRAASAS